MSSLDNKLNEKLSRRKEEGLLRKLKVSKDLIDFSSNDYLGLARSEELFNLINNRISQFRKHYNGSTGSRLLTGNSAYTEQVEEKLASIFNAEAALIFNSGYVANQAVLSSVPQKGDTILYDELAHACIKDGARLSLATRHAFFHNDLEDLEKKIKKSIGKIFIAVESIYSMDGDECPLQDLNKLAKKYEASILVDEAHSTGVMGMNGSGLINSLQLEKEIDIRIYTFGKAMGIHGACVVGSKELIYYLINFARPFIFTTALPPHSIASIECAFDFIHQKTVLQKTLKDKVDLFFERTKDIANKTQSKSAIQTIIFGDSDITKQAALYLQQKGFDIRPILSPTVPKNKERLRICLHSFNTDEEINLLAEELKNLFKNEF
jgi:8-amino-7-oxononanoate synthase